MKTQAQAADARVAAATNHGDAMLEFERALAAGVDVKAMLELQAARMRAAGMAV